MHMPSEMKIVTDEAKRPVAVQIPYKDWLEIERRLGLAGHGTVRDLSRHVGRLILSEDAIGYQEKMRDEWS